MRTRHFSSSDPVSSHKVEHRPVLLHESLGALDVQPDDVVVDATLGGAGHAKELVKGLGGNGLFVGFDMDSAAIARAEKVLADSNAKILLIPANFRHLERELAAHGITKITKILFDLGWSSYQLDSGRGFSFQTDEPLLMTYASGTEGVLTAERIVNEWGEGSLADIIFGFGEERYARRIAKAIVARRAKAPFKTSRELGEVVRSAVPASYRHGRTHPATRTFQALRIAVNDELGALSEGLASAWKLLEDNGRIAVISFHSIEDRIVKRTFARWAKGGEGRLITKKPICPSREEVAENPRARSAKFRVIQKIEDRPDAQSGQGPDRSVGKKYFYESPHTKDKQVRPLDLSGEA